MPLRPVEAFLADRFQYADGAPQGFPGLVTRTAVLPVAENCIVLERTRQSIGMPVVTILRWNAIERTNAARIFVIVIPFFNPEWKASAVSGR